MKRPFAILVFCYKDSKFSLVMVVTAAIQIVIEACYDQLRTIIEAERVKGVKVKRIVANVSGQRISAAKKFYEDILGLDMLMDLGWIATYGSKAKMNVQISFMSEGGSGMEVPDISVEVDEVDEAYRLMKKAGFKIEYELTDEPWGVRRFFVRDPFGKLVNILSHI
jgi:catechol 2,3-dioxygenase-like lactoylglutathione lyase family enzyme